MKNEPEIFCTKCGHVFTARQHRHHVDSENAGRFSVKEGLYHAKCCPLE